MWRHNGQSSVSNHQPYDCYTTVYSDADQSKHQSSASLAFVWGIHRDRWIPRTKGQLRGKCFHLMTSSCLDNMLIILVCRSVPWAALSLLCVRTHRSQVVFLSLWRWRRMRFMVYQINFHFTGYWQIHIGSAKGWLRVGLIRFEM